MARMIARAALLLALLLVGCAAPPTTGEVPERAEIVVFTASSLSDAFAEIGERFEEQHPGSELLFNSAGSQQLAQQLSEGAPAQLFASANERQMQAVIEAGRVAEGSPRLFARNRLVVIYPTDNPARIETLDDLARPGLKLILAAGSVPVGEYSLDFLELASAGSAFGPTYRDRVLANVVSYEENVRAVLSKVQLGEADAGIVYSSDVTPATSGQVGRLDIPDALNVIAAYPIAPISGAPHPDLTAAFIDFLLSSEGQQILARHGFIPVEE